jgi:hypothetical protein
MTCCYFGVNIMIHNTHPRPHFRSRQCEKQSYRNTTYNHETLFESMCELCSCFFHLATSLSPIATAVFSGLEL